MLYEEVDEAKISLLTESENSSPCLGRNDIKVEEKFLSCSNSCKELMPPMEQQKEDNFVSSFCSTNSLRSFSNISEDLVLGDAEKQFYAMAESGSAGVEAVVVDTEAPGASAGGYSSESSKNIEVVRNILSDLEHQTKVVESTSGYINQVDKYKKSKLLSDDIPHCDKYKELPSIVKKSPGIRGSLVVDIHCEHTLGNEEGSKSLNERFPRCNSLSQCRDSKIEISRETEQEENINKIEKVPTAATEKVRQWPDGFERSRSKRKRAATVSETPFWRKSYNNPYTSHDEINPKKEEIPSMDVGSLCYFNPNVKFDISGFEDTTQDSEIEDICLEVPNYLQLPEEKDEEPPDIPHPLVASLRSGVPYPPPCTASTLPSMSHSSSTTSMPVCRICQLPSIEPNNPLISPCRCLGSIKYVHNPCLKKWLEVSCKNESIPPGCELCQYQYIRHKKFVISNWLLPSCSKKDKMLHLVFSGAILTMLVCSVITVLNFQQTDVSLPKIGPNTELSSSEFLTLFCGVLFFLAFFIAMYVEVKAENTLFQLVRKFFNMNLEWTIEEYDQSKDPAKQIDVP